MIIIDFRIGKAECESAETESSVTPSNDLLTCGNDLVSCDNDLLTCDNKIKTITMQFYVPSWAPYVCD